MTEKAIEDTKVIVGMSGGVDSAVAALLLKQQGYQVSGMFMKNWEGDDDAEFCPATIDAADAQSVCEKLGIELHTVNFAAEYWDRVFANFLQEYRAGRTPNPDILCNKEIKFKAFLDHAMHLGADYIATGHYVRKNKTEHGFELLRGLDQNKDQSYFLYTLNQQQLAKSLFPIGDHEKPFIRKLADAAGFLNHDKKDSTGICFIGEKRFKSFLSEYLPAQPGEMQTPDGKVVGKHDGLMYYTLGQRKGLGIGGLKDAVEAPWYVVAKDLEKNILLVSQDSQHPLLLTKQLEFSQAHWVDPINIEFPLKVSAKTRYRQKDSECMVFKLDDENYRVEFATEQWAVTPGQSVVLYCNEVCLGGGIING